MEIWTDEKIQEWILDKCWGYHREYPGGSGCFINNEKLTKDDPPLDRIAENVAYLQDKNLVKAEIGRAWKPGKENSISYILNLKLTSKGVDAFKKEHLS